MLAGKLDRYGQFWGTWLITAGYIMLFVPALINRRNYKGLFIYNLLQVLVPFVVFWVVFILVAHVGSPLYRAPQFIIVLPSLYILVAKGIQFWLRRSDATRVVLGVITLLMLVGSLASLQRYWQTGKSPEGQSILSLRTRLKPDDGIVSTSYSLNSALSFYLPYQPVYLSLEKGTESTSKFLFFPAASGIYGPSAQPASAEQIFNYQRIWFLVDDRMDLDVNRQFLEKCKIQSKRTINPFSIYLLNQCTNAQ